VHITVTHVFALATAWGMYKMRRDVGRLPMGTFSHSKKIGVTILCDVEGGKDLIPITIWDGHKMTIFELAKLIADRVSRAKKGKDENHKKATQSANFLPSFILEPLGFNLTYLAAHFGISIPAMGLRADTFGHVIITNVAGMGFTSASAPLCPLLHAMGLLCCGVTEKRAVVDQQTGEISAKSMMTVTATGDHRYGDAAIWVPLFKTLKIFMSDPGNFDEKKIADSKHYKELEKSKSD